MYQITCDGLILHDVRLETDYRVISPKCKLKMNTTGTLTFQIAPTHPYYSQIQKLKSEITLTQDGEWIFTGRVLNDEKDFDNIKTVECEGELAYLLDSNQRQAEYHDLSVSGYFTTLINKHNAAVPEQKKQFTVGIVNVQDNNDSLYRYSNYENTWNTIKDKLINRLGGYIRSRHLNGVRYIDYITDYGNVNDQVINFGENLLDLKQYIKGENIATAIIPLGATIEGEDQSDSAVQKRVTIESVNDGKDYVFDQDAVDLYGWVYDTVTFDAVTVPANLLRKGQETLAERKKLTLEIQLNAVDLHLLDVDIEKIKLGDKIRVISKPHGIDRYMTVSDLTIDISKASGTKIVLGDVITSLTDVTNKGADLTARVENIISDYGFKTDIQSIRNTVNELSSNLSQTAQNILLEVYSNCASNDDVEAVTEQLKSSIEILNNLIEFRFESAITQTETVAGIVTENQQLLEEYIRFQGALIELGKVGNAFTAKLSNEKLAFLQDNVEIAYISNNKLYITDAEIKNKLTIGNSINGYFDFIPRANGNLSLKWRES